MTLMIREAKKNYKDKLTYDLVNSKRWHRLVNQIIVPQNNTKSIQFLEIDDEIIQSDREIAEALNNNFVEQSTLDDSYASLPEFHPPN